MNTSNNATDETEMTDQQLAALEAKAEAEYRAEQAKQMEQAMKAVDFVSQWKVPHPATYGLKRK